VNLAKELKRDQLGVDRAYYWEQVGGTLIEEFCAVSGSRSCGRRPLDGVIIKGGEKRIARQSEVSVEGQDVIVVQTKASRLGMYLMGQALFSAQLMQGFNPRSVESVALVTQDDSVLRPLLEQYPGMRVVICPPEGRATTGALLDHKTVSASP
jgi:hypothetical protein